MKKYKVNEIFHSIQGEGFYTGTSAVFLRLAFCNLNCSWCDTNFFVRHEMTAKEIVDEINRVVPANHNNILVITGGEPLLQLDVELCQAIIAAGYKIHVETNGTIVPGFGIIDLLDWITVSPKEVEYPGEWIFDHGSELKIVVENLSTFADPKKLLELKSYMFDHHYLQPLYVEDDEQQSNINMQDTAELVRTNPGWKLSIQTQRILKIR